jgi:hypothetical protein
MSAYATTSDGKKIRIETPMPDHGYKGVHPSRVYELPTLGVTLALRRKHAPDDVRIERVNPKQMVLSYRVYDSVTNRLKGEYVYAQQPIREMKQLYGSPIKWEKRRTGTVSFYYYKTYKP